MATAYHMVHYRRFKATGENIPDSSLDVLCRMALDTKNDKGQPLWLRVSDRVMSNSKSSGKVVLNRVADLSSAVFGEMFFVQNKGLQAFLQNTVKNQKLSSITTAQIYEFEERKAPENSQFLRGLAYYLVVGDHLFYVKTQSFNSDYIGEYINWLLQSNSETLSKELILSFQAEFDKTKTGKNDIGDIKSLRVVGKSTSMVATPEPNQEVIEKSERTVMRKVRDKFVEAGSALAYARLILGPEKAESLVESLGPEESLVANASLSVRGRRTVESRNKLRELASELADASDNKIQIEGKDGKISDGDAILRTKMPFHIEDEDTNFLDFHNVADQLQKVYHRFVEDGLISA